MTDFSAPTSAKRRHGLTFAAGITALLLISGPATAATAVESVHVVSPRPATVYGEFDLPILDVTLSKPVSYRNLDLRTHQGAHTLRFRIRSTARELCTRLNFQYPVRTSGSPQCYRTAVNDAMHGADNAIREARYTAGLHTVHID